MRSTGIIRRLDDLGRIVIPKEIRKALHVHEADALEIFTATDDGRDYICLLPFWSSDYVQRIQRELQNMCKNCFPDVSVRLIAKDGTPLPGDTAKLTADEKQALEDYQNDPRPGRRQPDGNAACQCLEIKDEYLEPICLMIISQKNPHPDAIAALTYRADSMSRN